MMFSRALTAITCGCVLASGVAFAQSASTERRFPQSKSAIEKALKDLQSSASGRLPTLDGFATAVDAPLDRFQRGYYQCTTQVTSSPSGGSVVHVSVKITAWYADPSGAKSGYQALPSNGRLEADFLDRLEDALNRAAVTKPSNPPPVTAETKTIPAGSVSAPTPQSEPGIGSSKSVEPTSAFKTATNADELASADTRKAFADRRVDELNKEAKNLEEILRNQSHPANLVAVKANGTPIVTSPVEGAKVLFLASAEDEFEMLDMNASWVHVRISGLSRGWLRRSSVEMPDSSPAASQSANALAPDATPQNFKLPFQIQNEEIASFPGNWPPLQGKMVKIVSVQPAAGADGHTNSQAKLEFAKSILNREYSELSQSATPAAGVVLVFDSEDGGMIGATLPILQQWKAGILSDEALWRQCYVDPPEMLSVAATP
ncbi:MAG TPA: hypothetical protein VFB28_09065 [Terriglobales bacterium]|nr:hypothetical protein [Terriglobales bacterium]